METHHNTYATDFKLAFTIGLLSEAEVKSIPKSTRHNLRNYDFSKVCGLNYSQKELETCKQIADSKAPLAFWKTGGQCDNSSLLWQSIHVQTTVRVSGCVDEFRGGDE